ncbi:CPBP family intramembrane glutamic endopeptidase [Microbacterium album]|uniref:Abortive infection protein n=1 Tax=Microbacterium album TaxID=2053191 RepID=A0A917MLI4_9MICO|nr:CPBP family intramembrane glutamic endopeptidase [Microbacterium album]GGH38305.1 abortive infection protein [Microbacterium album]
MIGDTDDTGVRAASGGHGVAGARSEATPGATERATVPWAAVAVFLVVAFALAWALALPLWLGGGLASPWVTLVASAMMFTPAVATLVVCLVLRTPERGRRLRSLGIWPLRPAGRTIRFAVAAILAPPLIVAAAVFASAALGIIRLDLVGLSGFAQVIGPSLAASGVDPASVPLWPIVVGQLIAMPLAAVIPNGILAFGEEVGWRGWLLPALRPLGAWPALLLSGAIWGLWHAPLVLLGYNFGRPDVLGVLLMVGACTAWGVLFGWTRLRTGSVWPAVFGHGALNASAALVAVFVAAGERIDMAVVGGLGLVAWAVIAVVIAVLAATGQFRRTALDAALGHR